ncbi:hypothetical protein [Amycolatopsis echigonensis]|uniref:Molybdopterin-dependent oxidoreductase-like protein n=1 Tax=Amycolatopsis echigonensis TaxID=2576905 RepID=A0A2N3WBN5_9PSEU|nr:MULTISPECIES: hypothetical protein [Amycolatopsis]MBB2502903.1 hypothetical protein [Amycolatopsis echigonensis]PKV91286.1 hypothetical protein ATK30_2052 [Amycolatopsis niigatensis]
MRRTMLALAMVGFLIGTAGVAEAAPGVEVGGTVAKPGDRTAAQLDGARLDQVVNDAAPVLPPGKNTALRVTVRVYGAGHRAVTFALAELSPSFGNHPAVFRGGRRGVDLTVPGDRDGSRTIRDVRSVSVAVSAAQPAAQPVRITAHGRSVTLPPSFLAKLPRQTVTARFGSDAGTQTHQESGPPLALVLALACVFPKSDTPVVAVGADGYGAAVTLAEARTGGRPLLLSTVEDGKPLTAPRLVPLGDVKGGRYVSGVTALAVG